MAPVRPMLDSIELQNVQKIVLDEDQVFTEHDIPALEGNFFQGLGRRSALISLIGVMTGSQAADKLKTLRQKFREARPLPFISDLSSTTRIDRVLIGGLDVRDIAGKPERFEYALQLVEYSEAAETVTDKPPQIVPPDKPDEPIDKKMATLIVEVIVRGQPHFDHSETTVTADGQQDDGQPLTATLTTREDNIWTEGNFPAGAYEVRATTAGPGVLTGTSAAQVAPGQTVKVTIVLQPGEQIARMFLIHFWFDKAFIEPCMRNVLKQVADYAAAHPDEKLLIVGHTDLVGGDDYNQALSERRSRSACAFLTYGNDSNAAVNEWNELRKKRPAGTVKTIHDSWGVREYQYMLMDLGYYSGNITEQHDEATDEAVREFQKAKGLAVDGIVGDATWPVLIDAYLSRTALQIPGDRFPENSSDGCNGGALRWLGCGEKDPLKDTEDAWRPNRRTEFLFTKEKKLPAAIPQPVTFNLPAEGANGAAWCLDGSAGNKRCCFVQPHVKPACPSTAGKPWLRQPVEKNTVTVHGSIRFEDGSPAANIPYVLIAPNGKYMDGERPSGPLRGRPDPGRTDAQGTFSYPGKESSGIYVLAVKGPYIVRRSDQPPGAGKGNTICKYLDGSAGFDVILTVVPGALKFVDAADTDRTLNRVHWGDTIKLRADVAGPAPETFTLEIASYLLRR